MEQVNFFGGWVEGAKSLWCQGFADRQPYRTGGAPDAFSNIKR